ncbi:MAG TPA: hypothetical protein PKN56_06570 [Leptospiraceae bacterium]|nr:hypothetical protein [Leptospiraceae bacterium]
MEYSAEISYWEKYSERRNLDVMSEKPEYAKMHSYYCAFHAIFGLLYLKDAEFSSHSQTLGYSNKEFIHSEILGAIQNYIQENF